MNKLLFSTILVFSLIVFSSCGKEEKISSMENADKKGPQLIINKFSITATNAGKLEWVFHAREAIVYDEKNLVDADDIKMDFFFDKNGKEMNSHLTSAKGSINTKTNDMEAEKNVVLTTENGDKLFTQKVKWLSANQKFFTEESVRVEKKDSIVTGIGMEADPNLENIRILQDVKVEGKE